MSRLPTRMRFCLPLALLGLPSTGAAQAFGSSDDTPPAIAAREQAKAAFESSQAATRDLARARLDAARTQLRVRYEMYQAGVEGLTLDFLLETVEQTLRAALAVRENQAERWAALEGLCSIRRLIEKIVGTKYLVGRIGQADYASARCLRLKGEMRLAESGARPDEPIDPPDELTLWRPLFDLSSDSTQYVAEVRDDDKAHAREKFAAVNTPPRELARMRWESARAAFQVREEKYRQGTPDVTLDLLLDSSEQLLEAELAVFDKPSDRLAALARHWRHAWLAEQIVEAKYRFGRAALADLMQAREVRLDAETKLAEARARQKLSGPFWITPVFLAPETIADSLASYPAVSRLVTREIAKAQFESSQRTAYDLALARRDAAVASQRERMDKYWAGAQDARLDWTLEASRRRLEAELAVLDNPAERLAAHRRYCELTRIVEDIVAKKYELGRVSRADLAQARYDRLDAEIRLAEERAKHKVK